MKNSISSLCTLSLLVAFSQSAYASSPTEQTKWVSEKAESFAEATYRDIFTVAHDKLDDQIFQAKPWFVSQGAYDSYVESFKSSGNYAVIEKNQFLTKVSTGDGAATQTSADIWEVKFPAEIAYLGDRVVTQCLAVTANVKHENGAFGIVNVISEGRDCD